MDVADLREEYRRAALSRATLAPHPMAQFEQWFQQACQADLAEPNAMILATVSPQGQPAQRTVLLKYFDLEGLVFFTNYGSRKGQHIAANGQVSLLFLWLALERQVEIQGRAEPIPTAESLRYFLSRPRGSQLGAWCSPQSQIITSRKLLELKFEEIRRRFANRDIPLPEAWGGYRVRPQQVEFWQGRPNRLHDRFRYQKIDDASWTIERLAP